MKKIVLPLNKEIIGGLGAGETVLLSGVFFTGRDAAHKRFVSLLEKGESLPFDIKNQTIYYTGPCPAKRGAVGSCGPTTSCRMDSYTPVLLDRGLKGMIGKGERSAEVIQSIIKNGAVYFAAIGGAGALYSLCVKKAETVCFPELGTEAVFKFTVEDFPAIVAVDCRGNSIY